MATTSYRARVKRLRFVFLACALVVLPQAGKAARGQQTNAAASPDGAASSSGASADGAAIFSAAPADGAAILSGATADGAAIFKQRCSRCHGEDGGGISSLVTIAGPSLQAEHNPGDVMRAMEVGPEHMPVFSYVLSVDEMRSVAKYVTQQIAIIPLAGGDLSEGGSLFRVKCAGCHRTAARGGVLAFTGINAPSLTTKSAALVAGAIRWGPGPMPKFPASVLNDQQLDSIVKYVEFVQHPPDPGGNPLGYSGPVAEGLTGFLVLLGLIGFAAWIERGGKG